jgi:hypothetical protein
MNQYEKLKHIILSDPKKIRRYKTTLPNAPTKNGYIELLCLTIIESNDRRFKKPNGSFNSIMSNNIPYSDRRRKYSVIHILTLIPNNQIIRLLQKLNLLY